MEVRLIENKELLESAELFKIENLLWGTDAWKANGRIFICRSILKKQ